MLPNQSGVWLPTATKRQTLEAEAGEKEKRLLFEYWMILEKGRLPHLNAHLLQKTQKTTQPSLERSK